MGGGAKPVSRELKTRAIFALVGALTIGTLTACTPAQAPAASSSSSSSSSSVSTATDSPPASATPDPVGAVVSIAGVDLDGKNVSVSGYVSGVIQDGGSCEFVLTPKSGTAAVTIPNTGIQNVMNTSCGTVQSPISNFARGSWSVVLKYTSGKTSVTSGAVDMEIP
ncbi:MAG: hypothetical protein QOD05_2255 [Microbacteriaceae bacterium]|jgi:hypothetical protein|nr:hypothetical protein [Microbacteriaceae bacterium]